VSEIESDRREIASDENRGLLTGGDRVASHAGALANGLRLSSSDDFTEFIGGLGFSFLLLVGGLALLKKTRDRGQVLPQVDQAAAGPSEEASVSQ
jgi:hypothetical protein